MDKGEVVDKDGAGVVEGEERAWEGRLCEEVGREGLACRWSRDLPPRWQQQQTRKAHSLGHPHRRW